MYLLSGAVGLSEETCMTIFCCKLTLEMDLDASSFTGITMRSIPDGFPKSNYMIKDYSPDVSCLLQSHEHLVSVLTSHRSVLMWLHSSVRQSDSNLIAAFAVSKLPRKQTARALK